MKTSSLDMHKDTIFCAIYDEKVIPCQKKSTATVSIRSLDSCLKSEKVKQVAMKSKGKYP